MTSRPTSRYCWTKKSLPCGVPQGSTLGPVLFLIYMSPLSDTITKHQINNHTYADDTQLYTSFKTQSSAAATEKMEMCVREARKWITSHELKLNESKTELILCGTKQQLAKVNDFTIRIGDVTISPSDNVRNLGIYMDSALTMTDHVSRTSAKCMGAIQMIKGIRAYLSLEATKTLMQTMVLSHLDYGNAVLHGITAGELHRLQRMQNIAARVTLKLSWDASISRALQDLHWLPVKYRVLYKLLLVTFKVVKLGEPRYLSDMLSTYKPTRQLRSSSDTDKLCIPFVKSETARRGFRYAAPYNWNDLPKQLRELSSVEQFKKQLKTYLFALAFN